jgi:hypothetical protein
MKKVLVFFLAMGFLAGVANAEFIDHGGGMIYDTDLKITWYDAPIIPRPYSDAINWVASLTLCNTVPNSWRFPSTPGTVTGCTTMVSLYRTAQQKAPRICNSKLG